MKVCNRCGIAKPVSEFSIRSDRPSAYRSQCKACVCIVKNAEYARNKERYRDYLRKSKYGISGQDYRERLAAQGNRCMICDQPERVVIGNDIAQLAVDHDHETGAIRDLLCSACNRGLAAFADDPSRLEIAAAYLRRHGKE